jgi:hypothetical protein
VHWIERTYHRRRRQRALGRLTPIEYETIYNIETSLRAGQVKESTGLGVDPPFGTAVANISAVAVAKASYSPLRATGTCSTVRKNARFDLYSPVCERSVRSLLHSILPIAGDSGRRSRVIGERPDPGYGDRW